MHTVMIHAASYDNVRQAVDRVFETFPLALTGKTVLIKPNALRASKPEEGIVTHPAVLRAVVERVEEERPACIVVGDNPGAFDYGANERTFRETGLMDAAKGYYVNIGVDSTRVAFHPEFMESVGVSRIVLEADVVISLPKFKTHGLTVITGAVKNSYGILPGAQKARLHKAAGSPRRFHDLLVEVFRLRVPDLFIVDAVTGMEGNGPASPELRSIGLILAGDNAVAVDAVIAHMMGCDPGTLRFLQRAKELGLGDYDLDRIRVVGELVRLANYRLPPLSGEAIMTNERIQQLFEAKMSLRPRVDAALCTACGTCVDHCPVSALSMPQDLPQVDPAVCITCFCCQEMCPEKAIALG
ncbi:Uncharacterized conserved protein, DUF362 family [Desulfacinum hydrothermale DSM 13146]|uniref:Uncharacterized conserved protein, DUF362 family n=1 Tax=Desulfacinum hydrothermale DSM 13146 TaxID=1121390 RepID=A0A1W1XG48_9BACT|nr:DUF362 domain-containing protein [Desulfacinum hydrothermale]SMC22910.1 Uncharacterized conserved protein, DUF362 family [Desulfacinum hydrothermale DSM 13146]